MRQLAAGKIFYCSLGCHIHLDELHSADRSPAWLVQFSSKFAKMNEVIVENTKNRVPMCHEKTK